MTDAPVAALPRFVTVGTRVTLRVVPPGLHANVVILAVATFQGLEALRDVDAVARIRGKKAEEIAQEAAQ